MPEEKDPYIGEVFEDRDTRSAGRRIKLLELHPRQWGVSLDAGNTAYRAIRVDALGVAITNRRVRIIRRTLDSHYRKVSH